jgi:type IV secretion system protein VirB3
MSEGADRLFIGPTRPAMKWGVTIDGIIVGFALAAIVMIGTGNPFSLLLYLPIHGTLYLLCLRDPRIVRLLVLWVQTKLKSLGWRHWQAATACPLVNTRTRKRLPQ